MLDILQEQGVVFNQPNSEFKDYSSGIVLNNNESDKLILQLENRIKDIQEINSLLKDKINYLRNK